MMLFDKFESRLLTSNSRAESPNLSGIGQSLMFYVVADNYIEIAMDKSGCCALQHCVRYAEGVYKKCLADQITSNALVLSEHSFGNYVVQFILGLRLPQYTTDIIRQLQGNFVYLAMNKYGSNFV